MNYKYCLYQIRNGLCLITLSNDFKDIKHSKDATIIYNVTVHFIDGDVEIEGIEDRVYFRRFPTKLTELEYSPRKEDIKISKEIKLFGFKIKDSYCYVEGWYRTEPIDRVKYTFKNYALKECL